MGLLASSGEYLQEVLLLMLASKPVLVSANRSDNGKFSRSTETTAAISNAPQSPDEMFYTH